MSDPPFRLLPALDDATRGFWTSGADGRLRIRRCSACGFWVHPPAPRCPACLSKEVAYQPVSGRGVVHTFTVNHHRWNPLVETPYVVAIVELVEQEGLRLMTNLVDVDPDDVVIGEPVGVTFEAHGEVFVPLFRPIRVTKR